MQISNHASRSIKSLFRTNSTADKTWLSGLRCSHQSRGGKFRSLFVKEERGHHRDNGKTFFQVVFNRAEFLLLCSLCWTAWMMTGFKPEPTVLKPSFNCWKFAYWERARVQWVYGMKTCRLPALEHVLRPLPYQLSWCIWHCFIMLNVCVAKTDGGGVTDGKMTSSGSLFTAKRKYTKKNSKHTANCHFMMYGIWNNTESYF